MTDTNRATSSERWTGLQAYTFAVICLFVGIAGGWLFRGTQSPAPPAEGVTATVPTELGAGMNPPPTSEQMRAMGNAQATPLLEKLQSDPNNAELLANLGNVYYDTQQYPIAINYYQRSLKLQPANTDVRTDMATAYWYTGDADTAIEEFRKSLSYEPNKPNTLFNLGIVEWQGKMDVNGAVATWQKLLGANPNYPGKDKVIDLIAQAKKHPEFKPGTPAKPLPQ